MTGDPVTVREALVSDPRVLEHDASIRDAARLLARPGVGSVLVIRDGLLVGAVTVHDIVQAVADGADPAHRAVGEIATGVETIVPEAPLDEAIHLMAERELDRLAVVEHGRLIGILPREGLVRRLAEDEPPPEPEAA